MEGGGISSIRFHSTGNVALFARAQPVKYRQIFAWGSRAHARTDAQRVSRAPHNTCRMVGVAQKPSSRLNADASNFNSAGCSGHSLHVFLNLSPSDGKKIGFFRLAPRPASDNKKSFSSARCPTAVSRLQSRIKYLNLCGSVRKIPYIFIAPYRLALLINSDASLLNTFDEIFGIYEHISLLPYSIDTK
jgi:hypothetical protein